MSKGDESWEHSSELHEARGKVSPDEGFMQQAWSDIMQTSVDTIIASDALRTGGDAQCTWSRD